MNLLFVKLLPSSSQGTPSGLSPRVTTVDDAAHLPSASAYRCQLFPVLKKCLKCGHTTVIELEGLQELRGVTLLAERELMAPACNRRGR